MTRDEAAAHCRDRVRVAEEKGWPRITFYRVALRALDLSLDPNQGPVGEHNRVVLRTINPVQDALQCR
jgi:hypothetical protein